MEAVVGLMQRMNLSEEEKKGIKLGSGGQARAKPSSPQAIRKVPAEKPINAEGIAQALVVPDQGCQLQGSW
jgi:hypothetical protein